jgi:hypothetical protein
MALAAAVLSTDRQRSPPQLEKTALLSRGSAILLSLWQAMTAITRHAAARQPVTILAAVERRVILNRREQNEACWPYLYYADHDEVVHDYDGTVRASREMRSYGVTDDYIALLPKWMHFDEFANDGRRWSSGRPGERASADEVLDIVAHLGLDTGPHLISSVCVVSDDEIAFLLGHFAMAGETMVKAFCCADVARTVAPVPRNTGRRIGSRPGRDVSGSHVEQAVTAG